MDCKALISGIALQRGTHLEVRPFQHESQIELHSACHFRGSAFEPTVPHFMKHHPDKEHPAAQTKWELFIQESILLW